MRKSIILVMLSFVLFACSNNNYIKLVNEKFSKSKSYDNILQKNLAKKTYYKYNLSKKFWEERVFLVIEKEETNKLYMAINYRGSEWLYMKSILFNDANEIDFSDSKNFNPIWKDNTTITMGVEEKILFPLDEISIKNLETVLENKVIKITLKSDYDNRTDSRTLTNKEILAMQKILSLYKSTIK